MKTKSHLNLDKVFYFQLSVIGQRDNAGVSIASLTATLRTFELTEWNIILNRMVRLNKTENSSHYK